MNSLIDRTGLNASHSPQSTRTLLHPRLQPPVYGKLFTESRTTALGSVSPVARPALWLSLGRRRALAVRCSIFTAFVYSALGRHAQHCFISALFTLSAQSNPSVALLSAKCPWLPSDVEIAAAGEKNDWPIPRPVCNMVS